MYTCVCVCVSVCVCVTQEKQRPLFLLSQCGTAMFGYMTDLETVEMLERREVEAEGQSGVGRKMVSHVTKERTLSWLSSRDQEVGAGGGQPLSTDNLRFDLVPQVQNSFCSSADFTKLSCGRILCQWFESVV